MKNKGFKFYSNYLKSNCIVTRYINDKHWWFRAEKGEYSTEMKAGTRLSYFKGQEDEKKRQLGGIVK